MGRSFKYSLREMMLLKHNDERCVIILDTSLFLEWAESEVRDACADSTIDDDGRKR